MSNSILNAQPKDRAYVVTGPTSGIGRRAAFELAKHDTVVLVGRDPRKLDAVQKAIEKRRGRAVSVLCDLSDIASVRRAAEEIVALRLPIAGLLNNAGISPRLPMKNALGWDLTFATNHLGPFALTDSLVPHLPDGANVAFVVSAVEDPERKIAVAAGFRGGRYISAQASLRGEWRPGGSTSPTRDAYATSKQCALAAALELARETPRLHFNALEPGLTPNTGLARDFNGFVRFLAQYVLPVFAPFMKYWSTARRAGRVAANVLINPSGRTGIYYNEKGQPMQGSAQVRDPKFAGRVVAETRALLATLPQ